MAARLAEACDHPSHALWPQQISLLQEGLIGWERILGPRQISDAYLQALAVAHGGRLNRGRRRERSADGRHQLDHHLPGSSDACMAISPPTHQQRHRPGIGSAQPTP